MLIPEKAFDALSVVPLADLPQLHPVKGKLVFSQFLP